MTSPTKTERVADIEARMLAGTWQRGTTGRELAEPAVLHAQPYGHASLSDNRTTAR